MQMVLRSRGRVCRCLFLESPHHLFDGDFLFMVIGELKFMFLTATGSPPFNFKCRWYCSYVGEYVAAFFYKTLFIYLDGFFLDNLKLWVNNINLYIEQKDYHQLS